MRRLISIISIVFVVFMTSCALKEPDLSSNIGIPYPVVSTPLTVYSVYTLSYKLGYSSSPNRFSDIDPEQSGIQDEVIINFNAPLVVQEGGVSLFAVSGRDTGEVDASYVVNNYEKQMKIVLNDIKDSTTYEIHLSSSHIKDLSGNFLDGNYNGKPDASYDDFIMYFRGPRPNADIPDNSPFSISFWYFSTHVHQDATSHDTIYVVFNRDIDFSTIEGNFALYAYPDGKDYTDNIVGWDTVSSSVVYFVYDNLPTGASYVFVLKDGLKDTEGRGFDGDGDGILELGDTATLYFNVALFDSIEVEYPKVEDLSEENRGIIIEFTKPLDIESITDSTVIVFDTTFNRINAKISLYPDKNHLYVEPMLPILHGKIFLSRNLKDTMGYRFDGNENGFGGEPGKDDIFLNF